MRTISLIVVILSMSFNCEAYYEGAAQKDRGMRDAYLQLDEKDNEKAIGYVEQNLDYAKPSMMWGASNAAYNKKQITRSAFLFYAGWLRIVHDEYCYVADDKSRKEALGVLGIMRVTLGAWIANHLKHSPKERDDLITALQEFNMRPSNDYTPDWKTTKSYEWSYCQDKVLNKKKEMVEKLKSL